ncbi:MAG: 3-phosphoshikimate 1-carboxyvinyltransferase [Nitrospinota bacterium]|nr:MAG: 3-phosphoshikimate 1-carboxyvinyltransferase [Nitrospinota bacterium]
MILTVPRLPAPIRKTIRVPGSKSLTNRALLIASLAAGDSTISGGLASDDTYYMIRNLRLLGVPIREEETGWIVSGQDGHFRGGDLELYAGNAGTTVRFLTALTCLVPHTQIITGDQRMQQRPIQDLVDALRMLGASMESRNGCPPVTVRSSRLQGGKVRVRGTISSQFLSALLMIAPYAEQEVFIEVEGDLVSQPYVDLTLGVMEAFGGEVWQEDYHTFRVGNRHYTGRPYPVEADLTSAGYWFALAALTGSEIRVANVHPQSRQADKALLPILQAMGCRVTWGDGVTVRGPERLRGAGEVDLGKLPDSVMTLAVVAALAEGETRIRGVANLRVKESDRLRATVTELRRIGIEAGELEDGLWVRGGKPHPAVIQTYNDHRIAMSFAILGTAVGGISICDPQCVNKSYPTFFRELEKLGT